MKKPLILFLVLLHCFLLGTCGQTAGLSGLQGFGGQAGTSQKPGTANGFDSNATPEIVISEDKVEWEELRDFDTNELMGYLKCTYGKNNNEEGTVLLEIYDRDKNLLHTLPSKLPGGTMSLTQAWDMVYISDKAAYGSNSYSFKLHDLSHTYSYEEYRNGATTRLDLYGSDGQVVRTLTPSDPANQLDLEDYTGVFKVTEGYTVPIRDSWAMWIPVRSMYYTETGDLLLDNWYAGEFFDEYTYAITRIEAKDEAGNVLYVHNRTVDNCTLQESYNPDAGMFVVREEPAVDNIFYDRIQYFQECRDPQTMEILYSVRHVYQDDQLHHTEMFAYGGKVEVVAGPTAETYSKLDFYDPEGVLQATFEAPEEGGWMTISTVRHGLGITFYNAAGEWFNSAIYHPINPEQTE